MSMNFMNDMNFLAANNIIGYDTYADTFGGLRRQGINPFGTGNFNTGIRQDGFYPSKTTASQILGGGLLAGIGLSITSKLLNANKKTRKVKNSAINTIKKTLGFKGTKTSARKACKAAPKGFKAIMSKVGKGCKIGIMATGIATIAIGVGKTLLNSYQTSKMPLTDNGQPREEATSSNN